MSGIKAWDNWRENKAYGEIFYKRAIGELEEMECSKSIVSVIKEFYTPGDKILDVGCGAGHYLRSFRNRLDADVYYTGTDITPYYIELAHKAFPEMTKRFFVDDIFESSIGEASYDIVMANNFVSFLPPPPIKAIESLLRVSSKYTVMRLLIGQRNYIIQEIMEPAEIKAASIAESDLISADGVPVKFSYCNMYTISYLTDVIKRINPSFQVSVYYDKQFSGFNNEETAVTGTKVINGIQVSGNLLFDWVYIVVNKKV